MACPAGGLEGCRRAQALLREFRDDVVRVARDREAGVTVEQIAKDFGVHPMTLFKWLRQADVDAGATPATAGSESAELREARKRIRLLEQENEVLRRAAAYLSQAHLSGKALPAREPAGRRRDPRGADVPGVEDRSPALLPWLADLSPAPSKWRRVGPTRCSTPIVMIRSSAAGSWFTRLAMRGSRWPTVLRGGSAPVTAGGVRSASASVAVRAAR